MSGSEQEPVAIILAGGRGERAKPITLESADYIRSKALIPFAGRPLIEWVVQACRAQGIRRFHVVAQGQENRSQIKSLLEHGERYGVEVRYSRPALDRYNVGSGAATLHNLEQWDLTGPALVLPVDSVFEFSLENLLAAQRRTGAVVTVASVERGCADVAGKYGAMLATGGLVRGFVEKPDAEQIAASFPPGVVDGSIPIPTNAGMYLVDCRRLREVTRRTELKRLAQQRLDWGGDLLPWLVRHGLPVAAQPIAALGDLGNVQDYLETLRDVLSGGYPQMNRLMPPPRSLSPRHWIHESTLATRDDLTGTTLAEKMDRGRVVVGEGVRIGRHVTIGPDVRLEYADIGDGADLREGVQVTGSYCGDAAIVGAHARIADSYVGPMTEIRSRRAAPVLLERYSAVGDGAQLSPGSALSGVQVYPRLEIPRLPEIPRGTRFTSPDDVLRWAA
ncbi:sugar phosphate nucleotidyltransferase [Streptomyces sp. MS06]|uniref:sugar phosphate nucleotidyltransferase n=1 Tax=Streptomyces sp. MS06 TaxID=3385974 RepID=UPI00399F7BC9